MFQATPGMPNWETVLLATMTMIASIAAAIGTFLNNRSIKDVHVSINSRMDQLLKSSVGEAMAAGLKEGRALGQADGRVLGTIEKK